MFINVISFTYFLPSYPNRHKNASYFQPLKHFVSDLLWNTTYKFSRFSIDRRKGVAMVLTDDGWTETIRKI